MDVMSMCKKYNFFGVLAAVIFSTVSAFAIDDLVVKGISSSDLSGEISSLTTRHLEILSDKKEEREKYLAKLYFENALEEEARKEGVLDDPVIVSKVKAFRTELLLKSLLSEDLKKLQDTVEEVAKERYETNKESYKTKKRIQISIIRLNKSSETIVEELSKLKELVVNIRSSKSPERLFRDFAKEYSVDENAKNGGEIGKWIIVPKESERSKEKSEVVSAAYALSRLYEVSEIIELENSYNLIMLMALKEQAQIPFSNAKSEIIEALNEDLWNIKRNELRQSLTLPEGSKINDELFVEILNKSVKN